MGNVFSRSEIEPEVRPRRRRVYTLADEVPIYRGAPECTNCPPVIDFGLIIEKLAGASNQSVFIGVSPTSGRKFAVKCIGRKEDVNTPYFQKPDLLAVQEIIFGLVLDHPSIAKTYTFGCDTTLGKIVVVNEFAQGASLGAVLSKYPEGMSPHDAQLILWQICGAIGYMHFNGIYHGDLKPDNIMYDENNMIVKVIDLGCASVADKYGRPSSLTAAGSCAYMPPEILKNHIEPIRSFRKVVNGFFLDTWAIGVILFEMVFGVHPFPWIDRCRFLGPEAKHDKQWNGIFHHFFTGRMRCDLAELLRSTFCTLEHCEGIIHYRLNRTHSDIIELLQMLLNPSYEFRVENLGTRMTIRDIMCHKFFVRNGFDHHRHNNNYFETGFYNISNDFDLSKHFVKDAQKRFNSLCRFFYGNKAFQQIRERRRNELRMLMFSPIVDHGAVMNNAPAAELVEHQQDAQYVVMEEEQQHIQQQEHVQVYEELNQQQQEQQLETTAKKLGNDDSKISGMMNEPLIVNTVRVAVDPTEGLDELIGQVLADCNKEEEEMLIREQGARLQTLDSLEHIILAMEEEEEEKGNEKEQEFKAEEENEEELLDAVLKETEDVMIPASRPLQRPKAARAKLHVSDTAWESFVSGVPEVPAAKDAKRKGFGLLRRLTAKRTLGQIFPVMEEEEEQERAAEVKKDSGMDIPDRQKDIAVMKKDKKKGGFLKKVVKLVKKLF